MTFLHIWLVLILLGGCWCRDSLRRRVYGCLWECWADRFCWEVRHLVVICYFRISKTLTQKIIIRILLKKLLSLIPRIHHLLLTFLHMLVIMMVQITCVFTSNINKIITKNYQPVHLQIAVHGIPAWKHSQYFLIQPDFLQEHP